MNENAKKLVEALRSGKYSQTRGTLRDKQGFCCLGVACDISGLGEWEQTEDEDEYRYVIRDYTAYDSLPQPVIDWLGFKDSIGVHEAGSLAEDNDTGFVFNEIANVIEETEELFKTTNEVTHK